MSNAVLATLVPCMGNEGSQGGGGGGRFMLAAPQLETTPSLAAGGGGISFAGGFAADVLSTPQQPMTTIDVGSNGTYLVVMTSEGPVAVPLTQDPQQQQQQPSAGCKFSAAVSPSATKADDGATAPQQTSQSKAPQQQRQRADELRKRQREEPPAPAQAHHQQQQQQQQQLSSGNGLERPIATPSPVREPSGGGICDTIPETKVLTFPLASIGDRGASPGGIEDNDGAIPRRTVSDGVLESLRAGTAWTEDGPLIGAGGSEDLQRALNAVELRKQRNRTAQRTFRERQKRRLETAEKEVKVLQDKVHDLELQNAAYKRENELLRSYIEQLGLPFMTRRQEAQKESISLKPAKIVQKPPIKIKKGNELLKACFE